MRTLKRNTRVPSRALIIATVCIVAGMIGASALISANLREEALKDAESQLSRRSLILAEQAERSFQSIELVVDSIAEHLERAGVHDSQSYERIMSGEDTHIMLKSRLPGLPQLDAITMINASGKLINFSRYWPIPAVNISDRDYFSALSADPSLKTFISKPVQNRGTGTWTIYIARRVDGQNGEFAGLILAAIAMDYFEAFYKKISLGAGNAESLMRTDGTLLARYPSTTDIGKVFPLSGSRSQILSKNANLREASPIDHKMRIKAAHLIGDMPLIMLSTQTEESVLAGWRKTIKVLVSLTSALVVLVVVGAVLLVRKWKQQELIASIRAEKLEAQRAKALAETELSRQQEQSAAAANKAKSAFLAVMSHEIRTPMNAVLGLTSTLLESQLNSDQRESVLAINRAGDSLVEIVNDILDFSKLEAGTIALELIAFAPQTLVDEVAAVLKARAADQRVTLQTELAGTVPPSVVGDVGRIRQILLNLVSNAIKFSPGRSVTLSVNAEAFAGSSVRLNWRVSDTGIGIPAERLDTLFDEFVQADISISRRYGGSGLGLAICKKYLAAMKSAIRVQSEVGVGSTFQFDLNMDIASMIAAEGIADEFDIGELASNIRNHDLPIRVLIVDDDPTNRMVASKMMREFCSKIVTASDGFEALDLVAQEEFDVILMDVRMPKLDGLAATSAIRAMGGRYGQLPIIAFTANAFAEDQEACREAGMTGFVSKPVKKNLLVAAVNEALFSRTGKSDEKSAGVLVSKSESPACSLDPAYVRGLVDAIEEDGVRETFSLFVSGAEKQLDFLSEGSAALADRARLRTEAHSLKSTAATFGLLRLAQLAAGVERQADKIDDIALEDAAFKMRSELVVGRSELKKEFGLAA